MSIPIIDNEALPVNEDETFDNICLDQEDPIQHYTIVPNALIRDKSISPECRWLIIFLVSNKPGWTIKSRQLWDHTQGFIGRDGIRKVLNEAIAAGYMRRDTILKSTTKGKLRGYSYLVSSTPKFKKVLREPDFQGPDHQGPEDQGTKELLSQELPSLSSISSLKVPEEPNAAKAAEVEKKASSKPKREKPDFTPKVREVGNQLINILIKHEPEYTPPKNLAPFLEEVDFMLRIDKRDPQKVYDIFSWALADEFWRDKMFKPNPVKYFRSRYLQLKNKMEEKPKANPNQVDRRLRDKEGQVVDAWKDDIF